jgi:hypothetical protein
MALTKEISRVSVTVDRGGKADQFWSNDVRPAGASTVCIVIWKEKAPVVNYTHKKSRIVTISIGISTLLVFAAIALITL